MIQSRLPFPKLSTTGRLCKTHLKWDLDFRGAVHTITRLDNLSDLEVGVGGFAACIFDCHRTPVLPILCTHIRVDSSYFRILSVIDPQRRSQQETSCTCHWNCRQAEARSWSSDWRTFHLQERTTKSDRCHSQGITTVYCMIWEHVPKSHYQRKRRWRLERTIVLAQVAVVIWTRSRGKKPADRRLTSRARVREEVGSGPAK